MRFATTIFTGAALATITATASPLVPRSPSPATLDEILGFSSDPQAGFDERTHGKVWVNGHGPGKDWAEGYGLGRKAHPAQIGDKDWMAWLRGEGREGESEVGSWVRIWEMVIGGASAEDRTRRHGGAPLIPGHAGHGPGYQKVPIGGSRTPHEPSHHHHHDEHHDHRPSPHFGPGPGQHHHHHGPHHNDVDEFRDEDMDDMLVAAGVRPTWRGQGRHGRMNGHERDRLASGVQGDRRPACFFGRLVQALTHLKPHESFLLTFTLILGLFSLVRLLIMFVILIKRSHQYANEVEGHPGAEYRRSRRAEAREGDMLPGYEEVVRGEAEAAKQEIEKE